MTLTASPFAKLKVVVVLFTSASGLLLHQKFQQRRSYILSSIYGDAANDNYSNDREWWEKVSTEEPISNYQQEDKINIDYFFPESTSERINYKIPAEMLGDKKIQKAIVQDLIFAENGHKNHQGRSLLARAKNNLVDLYFVGVGTTAHLKDGESLSSPICLFVSPSSTKRRFPAIAVPLSTAAGSGNKFLQLLTTTYQNKPISQAKCFPLSSILVNKDDGIFDNIPWNTWSILGNRKETDFDAAGNRVDIKYRFGKRDAYERFMGKELSDTNFSIGTMAALLLDQSEKNDKKGQNSIEVDGNTFDERSRKILLQRILKIELEEAQTKLAGAEQQLAIHRSSNNNSGNSNGGGEKESEMLQVEVAKHQKRLQDAQDALEAALRNQNEASIVISVLRNIFNRSQLTVDGKKNTAPYKGAYGYAASSEKVGDDTTMENRHTGPFDILNDLIKTQLRSNIIGIFLENISYNDGLVQLGGACVIQRQAPPKGSKGQIKIATETVDVPVLQDEEGEVKTGDVYVVECDAEEAIALSLATSLSICIEKSIWESLSVDVSNALDEKGNAADFLPRIDVAESEFSLLSIKEQNNRSPGSSAGDNSPQPTLAALASSSIYTSSPTNDDIVEKIPSLDVYDSLSIEEKAKIIRQSSAFAGNRLPRPRVMKQQSGGSLTSLDRLLIPLVDEAVRKDFLIREARKRKDSEALDKLTKNCSKRQIAMMLARMARNEGKNDIAKIWEEEADLLKTLRADITQDENSYSSLLDKDEWYERQRLATVSRLKKSNFGTLLDGIE